MWSYSGKRLRNIYIISWHIFKLFGSFDWDGLLQLRHICLKHSDCKGTLVALSQIVLQILFLEKWAVFGLHKNIRPLGFFLNSRFLGKVWLFPVHFSPLAEHTSPAQVDHVSQFCDHLCQRKSTHTTQANSSTIASCLSSTNFFSKSTTYHAPVSAIIYRNMIIKRKKCITYVKVFICNFYSNIGFFSLLNVSIDLKLCSNTAEE